MKFNSPNNNLTHIQKLELKYQIFFLLNNFYYNKSLLKEVHIFIFETNSKLDKNFFIEINKLFQNKLCCPKNDLLYGKTILIKLLTKYNFNFNKLESINENLINNKFKFLNLNFNKN